MAARSFGVDHRHVAVIRSPGPKVERFRGRRFHAWPLVSLTRRPDQRCESGESVAPTRRSVLVGEVPKAPTERAACRLIAERTMAPRACPRPTAGAVRASGSSCDFWMHLRCAPRSGGRTAKRPPAEACAIGTTARAAWPIPRARKARVGCAGAAGCRSRARERHPRRRRSRSCRCGTARSLARGDPLSPTAGRVP
jgi:hypothetical protein